MSRLSGSRSNSAARPGAFAQQPLNRANIPTPYCRTWLQHEKSRHCVSGEGCLEGKSGGRHYGFYGKVALITGGGGGIGRATALGFALRGAKVMVVDADADSGHASVDIITQRGGTAAFVRADVTQSASVRDYVEKTLAAYGRIDAFFNNAGIEGKVVPTQDYDEEVFDRVIAVNLKGVFLGMRHVLPVMLKQGSGAIVNTASVAGLFGSPGMPGLCRFQARRAWTDQGGVHRCGCVRRAGERGVPRTGGNADDAVA